jgi:hypothetical protein
VLFLEPVNQSLKRHMVCILNNNCVPDGVTLRVSNNIALLGVVGEVGWVGNINFCARLDLGGWNGFSLRQRINGYNTFNVAMNVTLNKLGYNLRPLLTQVDECVAQLACGSTGKVLEELQARDSGGSRSRCGNGGDNATRLELCGQSVDLFEFKVASAVPIRCTPHENQQVCGPRH